MRLFTAVFIPENIASEIYRFSQPLSDFFHSEPVKPQNMHITLKFFGNADKESCLKITENAAKEIGHFKVAVKGIDCFFYGKYASIIWAGIEDMHGMLKEIACRMLNDKKDFIPHITLARFKNDTVKAGILKNKLSEMDLKEKEFGSFMVDKINLVESILLPEGAKYETVKEILL